MFICEGCGNEVHISLLDGDQYSCFGVRKSFVYHEPKPKTEHEVSDGSLAT